MTYISYTKAMIGGVTLAMALTATAMPAFASNRETRSIAVKYDDLDLTTASGEARLRMRVKSAMNAICRKAGNDLRDKEDYQRCLREARNSQKSVAIVLDQARSGKQLVEAGQPQLVRK